MNNPLLIVIAMGAILIGAEITAPSNPAKMWIGDTEVEATNVGNKLVGERWIATSNSVILVHAEIVPLAGTGDKTNDSSIVPEPKLRLMLHTRNRQGVIGNGVTIFHGPMYMDDGSQIPRIDQTNFIDIFTTDDRKKIVVMILDNGPIYNTTNSGMTWTVSSAPGSYDFPLTIKPDGSGYSAAATIIPSPKTLLSNKSPKKTWYAIGRSADGSELVFTGNTLNPAPALSITHTTEAEIVSWPASFANYILQMTDDLNLANWVDVTNSASKVGEDILVVMPPNFEKSFYRLKSR
jgi:hypothetical protein